MQKLIDRYIINHFITKTILSILAFIVIFLLVDIIDHLDRIIDSEMPSSEIIKYYLHTVPWYFSLSLPMSLLLSTVFTFGILQKNNELSALKAAGISIKRIGSSLLILGIFFCIFSFYFDNLYVTEHMEKRNEIGSKYNLIKSKNNKIKKKDIFRQESETKILGIKRYHFRKKTAYNITIQNIYEGELLSRIDAPLMNWDSTNQYWVLPNHFNRTFTTDSIIFHKSKIDTILKLNFNPTDLTQATVKPEEMNYWELKKFVAKLKSHGVNDPRWAVNMHFKTAFACTSFLMILFGISLSIRKPRSNLAVGIGISIFVIFIYYVAIKTGQSLGYKGELSPLVSVWAPNWFFLCSGLILFNKTRT